MTDTKKTSAAKPDGYKKRYGAADPAIPSLFFRGRVMAMLFCVFSVLLLIKNPPLAAEATGTALKLCATKLVPSLFPFMVLSELAVNSSLSAILGRLLEIPSRLILGMAGEAGAAFAVGSLCGFPIGAVMGVSLFEKGRLSEDELMSLLCFSSNPGAAFVILSFGSEHIGSFKLGLWLYMINCFSALLIGVSEKYVRKRRVLSYSGKKKEEAFLPPSSFYSFMTHTSPTSAEPFSRIFTSSVKRAVSGMASVSGFVIFFSTLVGALDGILASRGVPSPVRSTVFGVFELTSAVLSLPASHDQLSFTLPLAAAFFGWSGLSVHFQIISVCGKDKLRGLRFSRYFLRKALHALCNLTLTLLLLRAML